MHFVVASSGFVVSSQPFRLARGALFRYVSLLQNRLGKVCFAVSYDRIYFCVCLVTEIHSCVITYITVVSRATILQCKSMLLRK